MELCEGVAPGFLNAAPVWKASKAGKDRSGGPARFGAGWQVSISRGLWGGAQGLDLSLKPAGERFAVGRRDEDPIGSKAWVDGFGL